MPFRCSWQTLPPSITAIRRSSTFRTATTRRVSGPWRTIFSGLATVKSSGPRGFGFYHETYVRGEDGQWRFSYRKLERTHAETSPGALRMAADFSP